MVSHTWHGAIVFQIKILRRLEGGDHTGVYLRPITHSKSLSGKLYLSWPVKDWIKANEYLDRDLSANRISPGWKILIPQIKGAVGEWDTAEAIVPTANFGCVHRHKHVLRIYGTAGTFLYDDAGARLHNRRNPAILPTYWPEAPLPAAKGDLIPDVIEGIEQGRD